MTHDPNAIAKALNSDVVKKAYVDGVSVPLKEFSKFATDIIKTVRLAFFPLQLTAACQDKLEKRLKSSIEQVEEENRIAPPQSILVPLVSHLSYIEDGNFLAELYQNLLARAIDRTRNSEAHPGFIVIISQLSPDESLLLYELNFKNFSFTRLLDFNDHTRKFSNPRLVENEFPVEKLIFSNNFDMYIEHLEKLDLICVIDKQSIPIWKDNMPRNIQIGSGETYTMGFTQFGKLFARACLPDKT